MLWLRLWVFLKIGFSWELFYVSMREIRIMWKMDFDLSQVLFRTSIDIMNITEGTSEFCSPGWALVHFGERHVTWFGPITSTYFELRYNSVSCCRHVMFDVHVHPLWMIADCIQHIRTSWIHAACERNAYWIWMSAFEVITVNALYKLLTYLLYCMWYNNNHNLRTLT